MAANIRIQARDQIATILTGLATTGARVFKNRLYKFREADLPALNIVVREGPVSIVGLGFPPIEEHTVSIDVQAIAKSVGDVDATLGQIANEVGAALFANTTTGTLNGIAKQVSLSNVDHDASVEADQAVGVWALTFNCSVLVSAAAPDVPL